MEDLQRVVGTARVYYIGGEMEGQWGGSADGGVRGVYFVYGVTQGVVDNQPDFVTVTRTTNFVVLWIVAPFILGSVVLFLAGRYFVRSLRERPTQLIEEEDVGASEDQFGSAGRN